LDEILVLVGESPELDVDFEARLWGSYLGEVLRRRYAGSWEMTQYPGGVVAVPAVEVRGSRLFPLMKVYRRLTVGEEEDLRAFSCHGDGAAGKAGAGELSTGVSPVRESGFRRSARFDSFAWRCGFVRQ
jgi:hypothetical protein